MTKRKKKITGAVLTPRQLEILKLIRNYRDSNGYSPTLQEIADCLEISKVTVFEHIKALEDKGMVHREPNRVRSLIVDPSIKLAGESENRFKSKPKTVDDDKHNGDGCYPMAGYIAAGQPIEAIQGVDQVDLKSMFETSSGTYVLKVRGNSMINDHICDGDFVLVQKANQANDGQVVVAVLNDGQATLKKIYREKKGFRLEGANPDFQAIFADYVDVQGIVVGVLRKFLAKSR
ncbi:MAG: transcriptional repressor LexA [Phycisphaerae bacterium]|nr:transcriptional repressor LexA [Phycisphaerae bacterium]